MVRRAIRRFGHRLSNISLRHRMTWMPTTMRRWRQGIAIPAEFADIATIHQRDLEDPTPLTLQQQQQYRTYANLGTVLLHGALPRLLKGEREALPAARSGMACLEAAIRLDPGAHFGRERWQLVIAHHLLLVSQDPAWLRRCDAVGNDLRHIRSGSLVSFGFADDVVGAFVTQDRGETQDLRFTPAFTALDFDAQATLGQRKRIRYSITPLTPDVEWISAVKLQGEQIALEPFDLPVLGILGMWTLGGGANPHFALALGTIMEQVGQGALAWECYERTAALAPNYSADPETRQWLIGHLVQRQQTIAGPRGGEAWESAMRSGFQQELSTALAVRSEFHQAEAARIAAGGAPMDAIADAEFWSQRPPLASQPGREDELAVTRPLRGLRTLLNALVTTVMGGALFALFSSGKRPRVRTSRST